MLIALLITQDYNFCMEKKKLRPIEAVLKSFNTNYTDLARAIDRDPSRVYRWSQPRSKGGTGGNIPLKAIPLILKLAEQEGVHIDPSDLMPVYD